MENPEQSSTLRNREEEEEEEVEEPDLSEEEVVEMLEFFGKRVASDVVCDALEELFVKETVLPDLFFVPLTRRNYLIGLWLESVLGR